MLNKIILWPLVFFCSVLATQNLLEETEKAVVSEEPYKFTDPDQIYTGKQIDRFPQVYSPDRSLPFDIGPTNTCQEICAHVRNKAHYAITNKDIGLVAQAYLNAASEISQNSRYLVDDCTRFVITGLVLPGLAWLVGRYATPGSQEALKYAALSTNTLSILNTRAHLKNIWNMRKTKEACRLFLRLTVGEDAVDRLDKIAQMGKSLHLKETFFLVSWVREYQLRMIHEVDSSGKVCYRFDGPEIPMFWKSKEPTPTVADHKELNSDSELEQLYNQLSREYFIIKKHDKTEKLV